MLNKIAIFSLLVFSCQCLAQDTLENVMARMQPQSAVRIAYQETRYMGLFEDEWQGSGYLYATTPSVMLKQQLTPEVEIMAAEGNQLTYQKPATQAYHQLQLDESNPMMASLVAFKAMLTGNLSYLRQFYQLKFITLDLGWKLEITALDYDPEEAPLKIVLQGASEQAAHKMAVFLPDGDRSAYVLSQPQQGLEIKRHMLDILQSLSNH